MGYIVGGTNPRVSGVEGGASTDRGIVSIPSILPQRSNFRMGSAQNIAAMQKFGQDVTRNAPLFNDPRYTSSTLAIPTDDRSLHGLYRFFAETDPIVGSALRIHVELPLADMELGTCEDTGVQQHFEEMWDRINGHKLMSDVVSEYWEIGNVTPFGAFNSTDYMWEQFAILNPDFVKVETTWVNQRPLIKLIPDEALKRVVQTRSPKFIYDQLPQEIVKYVLFNQEIPLDPNNVFLISHAKRPYEAKGRSLIKRILKVLMLEDRFNQANFALATRHAVPLTVVKVGDPSSVEGFHYVMYKSDDGQIHMSTFDALWNQYRGEVRYLDGGKQVKNISAHNLLTQTVDKNGDYNWHRMDGILRHSTPEEMVKIDTPVGSYNCTTSHGLMWVNPKTLNYEHVTPSEVSAREYPTVISQKYLDYHVTANSLWGMPLTPELSYFMGLWTAGGYMAQNSKKLNRSLRISTTDLHIAQKVTDLQKVYGVAFVHRYTRGDRAEITLNVKHPALIAAIFDYYGGVTLKVGREKLPTELLFNSDASIVGALFAGILDGYGSVTRDGNISICCGLSREYAHWLSLALLAQGITSKVTMRLRKPKVLKGRTKRTIFAPCYDLFVIGSESRQRFCDLVLPFVVHARKHEHLVECNKRTWLHHKVNVHDIDEEVLDDIFDANESMARCGNGEIPNTYVHRSLCRLSTDFLGKFATDSAIGHRLSNMFGVAVNSIEPVSPSSEFVYDLMLEDGSPHCYLTAGTGWLNTANTGWIPDSTELDAVREMFSNYELDPNFSLIYHYGIDIQFYGSNGRMLPVGPELDRLYRLKFIGMNVHEQLLSGQGGSYSQAYVNLEVQRQRYLNLQLKLENFVHTGIFKPVADLCGFYKIKQPVAGFGGVSSSKWGNPKDLQKAFLSQYTSLRDYQDNHEFQTYVASKTAEMQKESLRNVREYVYPKIDWGQMSATTDENLKNYIKWLSDKRPWLVDDATLARLAKLDRDTQEKAYISDLERKQKRLLDISSKGLLPFMDKKPGAGGAGGGGPVDFGGIGDIGVGGGGGGEPGADMAGGGAPGAPIGQEGPPPSAGGAPPGGPMTSSLNLLSDEIVKASTQQDLQTVQENVLLQRAKSREDYAVEKVVKS